MNITIKNSTLKIKREDFRTVNSGKALFEGDEAWEVVQVQCERGSHTKEVVRGVFKKKDVDRLLKGESTDVFDRKRLPVFWVQPGVLSDFTQYGWGSTRDFFNRLEGGNLDSKILVRGESLESKMELEEIIKTQTKKMNTGQWGGEMNQWVLWEDLDGYRFLKTEQGNWVMEPVVLGWANGGISDASYRLDSWIDSLMSRSDIGFLVQDGPLSQKNREVRGPLTESEKLKGLIVPVNQHEDWSESDGRETCSLVVRISDPLWIHSFREFDIRTLKKEQLDLKIFSKEMYLVQLYLNGKDYDRRLEPIKQREKRFRW